MKIILASKSPRRQELLAGLDIPFEVRVKDGVEESYPADLPKAQIPEYLSRQKADAYLDGRRIGTDEVLLTADTLVLLDGKPMGKPHGEDDARAMLRQLSGRTHQVITGVCLTTTVECRHFSVETDVTFRELRDEEIDYYVSHYRPLDKAGAYGVQEWIGYVGVESIRGSYYNVMGLPVQRIYQELQKLTLG